MYDLSKHTEQELFDIVVKGLASQKWLKSVSRGGCAYNGVDNTHCAAGHILAAFGIEVPDTYNTTPWDSLVNKEIVSDDHFNFIRELQHCHDVNCVPTDTKQAFRELAFHCNLTWPEEVE